MLEEINRMQAQSDFQRYTDLVADGRFYEYMEQQLTQRLGKRYSDRRAVKTAVLTVLYSQNSYMPQEKQVFRELFPSVYRVFALLKEGDYTRLPRLLQRLESYLFLEVIAKRVACEYPKVPLFTIHDNLVTTVGHEAIIKRIMREELTNAIGYAPRLRTEFWNTQQAVAEDTVEYRDEETAAWEEADLML